MPVSSKLRSVVKRCLRRNAPRIEDSVDRQHRQGTSAASPSSEISSLPMASEQPEFYDLLIVTDATYSMKHFLRALNSSLQDIIRISAITDCFSRIGVLGYRDYARDTSNITDWSGWHSRDAALSDISQEQLLVFVENIVTSSGYDIPEATKTGLAHAYQLMRPEAKTILLLYADAPPHTELMGDLWQSEQDELIKENSYGGAGPLFADWVSAARTLSQGEKRAQVFCIFEPDRYYRAELESMYTFLSTYTGGACLALDRYPSPAAISKVTVGLLLAWMGAGKQGATLGTDEIARQLTYADASGIDQVTSEKDRESGLRYLPVSGESDHKKVLLENIRYSPLSLNTLAQVIPRRERPVTNFAARYKADPGYQEIVVEQLADIIDSDASALALNPVFGTLWRTVCNDRANPARDKLITRFGLQADKMEDAEKKARLKAWLEESYDWAGEIVETLKAVPEEARYPCVFLDPTVRFSQAENDAEDENNSMTFTRDELLEIGRSCDYRILRRLGRILTRLTYVGSKEEIPAHVRDIPEEEVPKVPLALADPLHERKFWKVLLHTVLPGTMLAARPAALLAALSVRMGIKHLEKAAYTELVAWSGKWNTLDIPETWNSSCLGLLLEADKKYRQSMADDRAVEGAQGKADDAQGILQAEDRRLFETLVNYKLLEMNLNTTLDAQVGWTPNKSKVPMGPVVVCKTCQFPRSVTVMATDGECGLCAVAPEVQDEAARKTLVTTGVSKEDNATTEATWTECAMTDCRAQYVLYHPGSLNVRPKCHYCRQKGFTAQTNPNYDALTTAPCVTCTKCLNRVIYPETYRPSDFDPSTYTCSGCTANHPTLTTIETTPRALSTENGTAFLLRNDDGAIPAPFTNRSVFHTISISPLSTTRHLFSAKVSILPEIPNLTLTLRGKPLHNTPALLSSLHSWITARRVQTSTCTLCFTNHPKRNLRLACGGRRGCRQQICEGCVAGWYGLNRPGAVINVAALSCPFCRRQPTLRVNLPGGLRYLGGLRDAVEESGEWVYAWCAGCGFARRFAERSCARGVVDVGEGWGCEGCVDEARNRNGNGGGEGDGGLVVKMCPRCGVATEKTAGCDHVECVCGAHWCFNCGEKAAETAGKIYEHMSSEHRTWFSGGGEDEGVDYYWTDGDETDDDDEMPVVY